MQIEGIWVPIITPFNAEGRFYRQGARNLVAYLRDQSLTNIWLLGSYGAFPLLSEQERREVVKYMLSLAYETGLQVIVNASHCATEAACELARHAQDHGALAVVSVVPFYYAGAYYGEANILAYFESLVAAVDIPVIFYNNARATGFSPSVTFYEKLLRSGVRGVKDKGDYGQMATRIQQMRRIRSDAFYLAGTTSVHLQGYLLGANGVTSGIALSVPGLVNALQDALVRGDIRRAVSAQQLVLQVRNVLGRYVGRAVATYDVLHSKGVDVGIPRVPWVAMSQEESKEVLHDLFEIEQQA